LQRKAEYNMYTNVNTRQRATGENWNYTRNVTDRQTDDGRTVNTTCIPVTAFSRAEARWKCPRWHSV